MKSKSILGLDLGSNSLGWALLSSAESGELACIVDAGVRIFPKAVEEKTPTPKNQKRRNSRLARRIIQRRSRRKKTLLNYLVSLGLLPRVLLDETSLEKTRPEGVLNGLGDPYTLRAKALDQTLTEFELGRVLLHLVQRRGFLSNKKILLGRDMLDDPDVLALLGDEAEEGDTDAEETAFKADISQLRKHIRDNGCRTLGEYLASRPTHACKRNRHDEHLRTDRQMYQEELALIFQRQEPCHPILTEAVQDKINHIIFHQRPLKLKADRVGKCSLEPQKKRAAIARLEYQRFRYWQDINNLRYFDPYTERQQCLTDQDKTRLVELFETTSAPTFKKIVKVLGLDKKTTFNLETEVKKLCGNTTAVAIRAVYPQWDDLTDEKQLLLVEDLLSIRKKSALKQRLVSHWQLDGLTAVKLCLVELEPDYGNISLKAIRNLQPHLERGLIYSDARIRAGYGFEQKETRILDKLPAPPELPNPIVNKGLHELKRVVNALIAEYGKPDIIRIEMARDLEMNTKRYQSFTQQQSKNTKANDKATEAYQGIAKEHPRMQLAKYPSRDQKIRYRLWQDQRYCCAYSGKTISLASLFSADIEVDHILPYSRSLDDSYMNKVVCFAKENQNKGQHTPIDAFSGNVNKWEQITQAIGSWPKELSGKRDRFYQKEGDLLERDFIGSQLTDTRYISKQAGTYLAQLGVEVTFTRGVMTDWLRHQWQLNELIGTRTEKERTDHRHHTIDAVVTACIDRPLYNSLVAQAKALERSASQLSMKEIYVTPPLMDIKEKLADKLANITVSHVPQRKISGALHEETGVGFIEGVGTVYRQRLSKDFSLKNAQNIIDDTVRTLVVEHLECHENDPKRAFSPGFTLFHKDGQTPIKRVRVVQSKATLETLEKNKFAIRDISGKAYKWHAYGNTHHVEIVQHKTTGKYKGHFITTLEAAHRALGVNREKQPLIQRNHGDDWVFVMALHINDLVRVVVDGVQQIYRVQKLNMSGSKVTLRLHTTATIQNKNEGIEKSVNTLIEDYQMKLIAVNAIGKLKYDKTRDRYQ